MTMHTGDQEQESDGASGDQEQESRLVVRGHYHTLVRATDYRWIGGEYRRFDIIILPSLVGMNEYAHNVSGSKRFVTIGMVGIEVVDGEIGQVKLIVEVLDMATEESI